MACTKGGRPGIMSREGASVGGPLTGWPGWPPSVGASVGVGSGLGGREGGFVLSGLGGGTIMLITLDGLPVGTLVGSGVAFDVGKNVGKKVGLKVGDSVGSAVVGSGVIVGEGVGASVGLSVGAAVGASVGGGTGSRQIHVQVQVVFSLPSTGTKVPFSTDAWPVCRLL